MLLERIRSSFGSVANGLIPASVSALAWAVYMATLRPEVDWGDPAELALQADQLGVTHPPGSPVHTFLGKAAILLGGRLWGWEPGYATNALSAACVALTAGLLCRTAWRISSSPLSGMIAGLVFAFLPQVWGVAVVTEVYGVSVLFVTLALDLLLRWRAAPTTWRLLTAALVYGIALGSYLPNLLLLPGFALLASPLPADRSNQRHAGIPPTSLRTAASYCATAALAGLALLSWSLFRSRTVPPLGTNCVPDTPRRFLSFLLGAEYRVAALNAPSFYLGRLWEHMQIFGHSFLWGGLLPAIVGWFSLWREERTLCTALSLAFGGVMLYFTTYPATDYATMVAPAYLLASLWLAKGLAVASQRRLRLPAGLIDPLRRTAALGGALLLLTACASDALGLGRPGFGTLQRTAALTGSGLVLFGLALRSPKIAGTLGDHLARGICAVFGIALIGGLLYTQAEHRLARAASWEVTVFSHLSLEMFPPRAVVVAQWDKLPPLLYFQRVKGLRPDVTIVEPISPWHAYLAENTRPIFIDRVVPALIEDYQFIVWPHGWYRISRRAAEIPPAGHSTLPVPVHRTCLGTQ